MYFIIIFDLLWLFRVSYFVFYLIISWRRFKRDVSIDWLSKVENLPRFDDIWHVIFLPIVDEGKDILRPTLKILADSAYPSKKRFIVVLAGEERAGVERFNQMVSDLRQEFGDKFFRIESTIHKYAIPGDVVGKGSNLHHSGKEIKERVIDPLGLDYDNI